MVRAAHRSPRPYKVVVPVDPRSAARLRRTSRELAELAEGAARPGEAVALVEMDGGRGARLVRAPEELGDAAVFAP